MRKLFLMLAIMLTTIMSADTKDAVVAQTGQGIGTAYKDGKQAVQTLYGDVKEMGPKMETVITEIAKSLKITSTNVWDILVKQQKVWAWCCLVVMIISLISWGHFYYRFNRLQKDLKPNGSVKDSNSLIAVVSFLIALTFSIISGLHFEKMMSGFLNPEYPAMVQIIETAKSFK